MEEARACVFAVVINETLITIDAPLGFRVGCLALMPLILIYFFEIVLRLTVPFGDIKED